MATNTWQYLNISCGLTSVSILAKYLQNQDLCVLLTDGYQHSVAG